MAVHCVVGAGLAGSNPVDSATLSLNPTLYGDDENGRVILDQRHVRQHLNWSICGVHPLNAGVK